MSGWLLRLTLNQKLAAIAFVLGAIALGARPYGGSMASLNPGDLESAIQRGQDHVTAAELAAWVIGRRSDYRLIDVGSETDFLRYHIPTAENVPVGALAEARFGRTEKIVLYSGDGAHAGQGWMLLRALGYRRVYTVRGGLRSWNEEVVSPVLAGGATPDGRAQDERLKAISAFFGGTPRMPGTAASTEPLVAATPSPVAGSKVQFPTLPVGAAAAAPVRKKKEGC